MKSTALLASIAVLAASASGPLLASEHQHEHRHERTHVSEVRGATPAAGQGLQTVSNLAAAGDRAHGWRYFSDPEARRAVVISPQGDYYLSLGHGLRWVAAAPAAA